MVCGPPVGDRWYWISLYLNLIEGHSLSYKQVTLAFFILQVQHQNTPKTPFVKLMEFSVHILINLTLLIQKTDKHPISILLETKIFKPTFINIELSGYKHPIPTLSYVAGTEGTLYLPPFLLEPHRPKLRLSGFFNWLVNIQHHKLIFLDLSQTVKALHHCILTSSVAYKTNWFLFTCRWSVPLF